MSEQHAFLLLLRQCVLHTHVCHHFIPPLFGASFVCLNRRQMEMSQKAAEEDERYKKEMAKYVTNLVSICFS